MSRRTFHFSEGTSHKFWSIEVTGIKTLVHFGKIGTAGQAQEKEWPSAAVATAAAEKLIAEKTRKGYHEQSAAPAVAVPAAKVKPADAPPVPHMVTAATESAAPPVLTLERRVHLSKADCIPVGWLPWEPQPEPQPEPFDLEKCLAKVRGAIDEDWKDQFFLHTAIPDAATAAEAWFWVRACGEKSKRGKSLARAIEADARSTDFTKKPTVQEIDTVLRTCSRARSTLAAMLRPLLQPLEIGAMLLAHTREANNHQNSLHEVGLSDSVVAFRVFIAPFLAADARSSLKDYLSRVLQQEPRPLTWTGKSLIGLLAALGGSEEYAAAIASLPDKEWYSNWHEMLPYLAGLATTERFAAEAKRLEIKFRALSDARLWLVATEWRDAGPIVETVLAQKSKADAESYARVLALVEAPEAAPHMLRVQLESKAAAVALEWFSKYPLHAAVGLVPVARGQGKLPEAARTFLHNLRRSGRRDILEAALAHLDAGSADFLRREIIESEEDGLPEIAEADLPAELRAALAAVKPVKPPAWLGTAALPPVRLAAARLGAAQVERLLAALRAPGDAAALFAALRSCAEGHALGAFAWSAFTQWQAAGGPSKDKWAMGALGHLGGDAAVFKLTPLIREWPGESQHQRAVAGLEVLRTIGSDAALMALNGIAQKVKFQGLKAKAVAMMEEIAASRGFTRDELADRIVPECGLDARGTRVFDFGPRQFRFVLGGDMKPLVRDAAGKTKPDLPSPLKTDDSARAEAAIVEWKLLKKTLKETFKVQAGRLEDAMIAGRRWSAADFTALLVQHPLMVNLARQLVWSAYAADGRPQLLFRVTEDQTLADETDRTAPLPPDSLIGIVHPAHLSAAQLSAWGQMFADYEIIQPFEQLSRRICGPHPDDLPATAITRYAGPQIPGITVYGILERSHWLRDTPADAGCFCQHSKPFLAAGVTAFIRYEPGMGIGYYEERQEIAEIYFVPGHAKPDWWGKHDDRLATKDVDPVVLSEVLRLAEAIVAKAE